MDLGALRQLTTELNFDAHGVPATVTRPDLDPVETKGIWARPLFEDQPIGAEFSQREPRRVMAFSRAEFPTIERATVVSAPEQMGGAAVDWQTDGIVATEGRYFLVKMIAKTSLI
ncbi:MAG: hypothetical protein GY769_01800 [bacterium]|nr:hypothetical protein [bacterium]